MPHTPRNTQPFVGTRDRFGPELRQRDYTQSVLAQYAHTRGYDRLEVPALERKASFSRQVVGASPWPEWNPKGVFELDVPDYGPGHTHTHQNTPAVLIPEGTVSVARWLASVLPTQTLPLKVFYDLPCWRNEAVDTLSPGKAREFRQFGVEILGVASAAADAEIITFIVGALRSLGTPGNAVRVRISDVGVFRALAERSGFDETTTVAVKECLDALAECRAGKDPDRTSGLDTRLDALLADHPAETVERWRAMAHHVSGDVDPGLLAALGDVAPGHLERLSSTAQALRQAGLNVAVDLGVVRSHEYYTGLAFEVDVVLPGGSFVEIAGGGRYDHLIGHFAANGPGTVPASGFAFGIERLLAVMDACGTFTDTPNHQRAHHFGHSTADRLLVPKPTGDPVRDYLRAYATTSDHIDGRRVDLWVGEATDTDAIGRYAQARQIPETTSC
ncbi:ATP phosphoribosyltransferase regulatory subunit [Nocardiopsis sp. CNT312]|uniref:ATP phosphoribosyltransferase regulatory subunit n=1 Tax=Nocardiopsis sp. CNT312 TaxID=1137268 RepID=UPI00048EE3C9|nr:ATP phosphoribosyltransferase regulatory subunit [Nocardiopsis sp. CNT312]